jgi:hypothetical protein
MNITLTQQEADALMALEKHYKGDEEFTYPSMGGSLRIKLQSSDNREEFSLDIHRGHIEIRKNTFQTRARKAVVLARIDFGAGVHVNPDGEEIGCPHLHYYKEGYNDRWAMPLPVQFTNPDDIAKTLDEFMDYCKVSTKPRINQELFS